MDDPWVRPEVVLTGDVKMPALSGLGVLEALHSAGLRLPVVVMTVLKDESVHSVAMKFGAVGVLAKPFDLDDLRTALLNAAVACARSEQLPF